LVITQPDKPVGRKQVLTPPHVKNFLIENDIKTTLLQPATLKDSTLQKQISDLKPDFIVVAAFGMILPKEILQITPCINLHASLLPKYRGASPIQSAILAGDEFSGVTAMLMDEGLDTGEILGYSYIKLKDDTNSQALFDSLSTLAAKLTIKTLKKYKNILPLKQNELLATKTKKIKKSDGEVSFKDGIGLYRKFLAFTPWPGIYLKSGLKLLEIEPIYEKNEPSKILKIDEDFIIVGADEITYKIKKLQPASKKSMDAVSYIRGKRIGVGDTLV
jgi:methionyl-tRNA formyltransferase